MQTDITAKYFCYPYLWVETEMLEFSFHYNKGKNDPCKLLIIFHLISSNTVSLFRNPETFSIVVLHNSRGRAGDNGKLSPVLMMNRG